MRMRKKKWAVPELEASPLYIKAPASLKEQWQQAFVRPQPLYLELGCGKGGFASRFALANPEKNLLAVDISSNMLGVGRRKIDALFSQAGKIPDNVRLVAYDIERIDEILSGQDTVERIFINFCNPWPRPRHFKKRLTHPRQLEKYKTFLRPGGEIWFKTDDDMLFRHSRQYFLDCGFTVRWESWDLAHSDFSGNIHTELREVQGKLETLTANLDKMYLDRLSGLLAEADFQRIYQRLKDQRTELEQRRDALAAELAAPGRTEDQARTLVRQFIESACTNRELLVSLIERIELTEDKQIIIRFRFRELENTGQTF